MIEQILDLLKGEDFYGSSENIDRAKGKYEIPTTWAKVKEQRKRAKAWQLKK
jgi:hypothetical protein